MELAFALASAIFCAAEEEEEEEEGPAGGDPKEGPAPGGCVAEEGAVSGCFASG